MDKISSRHSELEELRHQAGQVTDDSLESTRRMLNMMEESEEAGRRTIETLDIQAEQLKRIEHGMDHINADMTKAERSLKRLKRCCNICHISWKQVPTIDESDLMLTNKTEKNTNIIVDQPQSSNGEKVTNSGTSVKSSNGYITRITGDAREDEMESNLCQVNSILGHLRNMAVDMNSELSNQNEQIENINSKSSANAIRLNQAKDSANCLLNS